VVLENHAITALNNSANSAGGQVNISDR